MIFAQTHCAFVAKENRYPGFPAHAGSLSGKSGLSNPPRRGIGTPEVNRNRRLPLFPGRFIRIPALSLEFLGQRIDRAVVILRLGFLVAAGIISQIELRPAALVRG